MTVELICPFCQFSKTLPREKIPPGIKWAKCPRCRQRFEIFLPGEEHPAARGGGIYADGQRGSAESETGTGGGRSDAPWEKRAELGLWQGIYQTSKAALFSPDTLFKGLTYQGGIGEPLAFGLLIGSLGSMFGFFWQFLILSGGLSIFMESFFGRFTFLFVFLILVVVIPLFVLIGMYLYAGVLHLMLLVVRGAPHGFEATFRVVCYSQAAQVWAIIPFLGGWVGGAWQLIVQIVGLREMHETSYFRVIAAFLIPVALFVLVILAILIPILVFVLRQPLNQIWS
jgi:hypothetical protein